MDLLWMCLLTPQQETIMARPRPVFGGGSPLSGATALRLATLASAPPPPKGGWAEGRGVIYRKTFTPASVVSPYALRIHTVGNIVIYGVYTEGIRRDYG